MSLNLVLCHIDRVSWFQRVFQFCSPYPVTNFLIHSPPGTLSPIVPSWGHHALKCIFLSMRRGSQKSAVQTEKWQSRLKKLQREPKKICDVISFRKNEYKIDHISLKTFTFEYFFPVCFMILFFTFLFYTSFANNNTCQQTTILSNPDLMQLQQLLISINWISSTKEMTPSRERACQNW